MKPVALFLPLITCACLQAGEQMEKPVPVQVEGVKNCYRLDDELYRSGQPDDDGFEALEKLGLKSVLNLREYHSDNDEAEDTKLALYRFKMAAGKVTRDELMQCLLLMDKAPKPILVHCWHGSDRTGVVCAAYRITVQGWTPETAIAEFLEDRFGHHKTYYANLAALLKNMDWNAFRTEFRQLKNKALEPAT